MKYVFNIFSKINKFYSLSNRNFKKFILLSSLVTILILFSLFEIGINSSLFWTIGLIYLAVASTIFPIDSQEMGRGIIMMILVFSIIIIIFTWLNGGNIPYTNIKADNDTIVSLFTIILAITTLVNLAISRQAVGLSRLSELDLNLNKTLCVEIENLGNYPVRGILLSTMITDKNKEKGWKIRKIKDSFTSPEYEKHYLASKKHYPEKLRDFLEKRFNLSYDEKTEKHTSSKKIAFKIRLTLNYHSDTFFKNPLPIIKEYEVEIDSKGMTRKEIKPSID